MEHRASSKPSCSEVAGTDLALNAWGYTSQGGEPGDQSDYSLLRTQQLQGILNTAGLGEPAGQDQGAGAGICLAHSLHEGRACGKEPCAVGMG